MSEEGEKEEFKHIVRILDTDLDGKKSVAYSLCGTKRISSRSNEEEGISGKSKGRRKKGGKINGASKEKKEDVRGTKKTLGDAKDKRGKGVSGKVWTEEQERDMESSELYKGIPKGSEKDFGGDSRKEAHRACTEEERRDPDESEKEGDIERGRG